MDRNIGVGFVGLGRMGANMARRLAEQGYRIPGVFDLDSSKVAALAEELGCTPCQTLAEVTACSGVIITVVSDDAAMRKIFDKDSPTSLLQGSSGKLFINCATVSPSIHQWVEGLVRDVGAESLEACLAGSITQARAGTLYLMCGGRSETFAKVHPVLDSIGHSVRYIGTAGQAARIKALVNMVMNANTAVLAEGLGLGRALGFNLDLLLEVFSQTGAASRVLETDGEDMKARDHECYYSGHHAFKDLGIALSMAKEAGNPIPMVASAFEQYQKLVQMGKGHLDKSAISEMTFPERRSN